MRKFGLLGRDISYSFSRSYFREKFMAKKIEATYENFDLKDISQLGQVIQENPGLEGLNVTIPYKEEVIPYLDYIDPVAEEIGAVNTIKISKNGVLTGYNTDYYGFRQSIGPFLNLSHEKALILGTGGASKAIAYALESFQIQPLFVSRTNCDFFQVTYKQLNREIMGEHLIIVNCTPLGTFPKTEEFPPIPYEYINKNHLIFDLIYNPPITRFMAFAAEKGAAVMNGQRMLELQAEKAWVIWNK